MATQILNDAIIFLDAQELTGQSNAVALDYEAESQDETVFGSDTRTSKGGLKTVGMSAEGFFESETDRQIFSDIGVAGRQVTVAPDDSAGTIAYTFQAMAGTFTPLEGAVGDIAGYMVEAASSGDLQRGTIMFRDVATSSGTSSGQNLGAASTSITAILHVYSASGGSPTLDVDIESDSTNTFGGGETTQISFTQATGKTAQRRTASSTADTWWRINYTLGGSGPIMGFVVVLILE